MEEGIAGGFNAVAGTKTGLLQPGHLTLRPAAIDLTRKLRSQ